MMQYPTIGRYVETLSNPDGLFRSLSGLSVSHPVEFSAGAYGAVFRVEVDRRPHALKCFTRHQPGRADAYRRIVRALNQARLGGGAGERHLVSVEWLDDEMIVFDDDDRAARFPALLMEWADGETLTKRMAAAVAAADTEELKRLSEAFDRLALWLLSQPFAHGDLKPDNLIVRPDGELTLIDYDGLYLPEMAGERARENGTEGFRLPDCGGSVFDERIDDFAIVLISLTLRVLARWPELYDRFRPSTGMLFEPAALVAGRCPVDDFLRHTEWAADPLLVSLKRGEARIERLAELLAGEAAPVVAYDYCGEAGREGIRLVRRGGKYGFAAIDGTLVAECRYDRARDFAEGAAAVSLEGRWGFVGIDGAWLREPEYDDCGDFSEGIAPVCIGGRWGFADGEFRLLSRPRFDDAWSFLDGRGLVRKGDRYGYVGPDGRMAIPARYDFAQRFSEGAACVMMNGLYGFIDCRGRWIVEPTFDYARSKHAGRAYVERDGRGYEIEL